MINKLRNLIFLSFLAVPSVGIAGNWHTRYLDSLVVAKQRIYSGDSTFSFPLSSSVKEELEAKSMVLFTPLVFYHSPVIHLLGNNDYERGDTLVNRSIDMTLMNIYLKRPDLVRVRESDLASRNDVDMKSMEQLQQHHPDIVSDIIPFTENTENVATNVLLSKPNFWNFAGDYSMQFMQNYVSSNWYKGGESNYSMLGYVVMQANYNNKQKVKWDNKLEVKLGAQTSKADTIHSYKVTSDMLRLTSKLGLQATKKWYYTLQVIGTTQTTHSYATNSNSITAAWFSPFTLNTSVGMDYSLECFKKKLTGTIHLAPLATNWKYVDDTSVSTRYGLDEGKHNLFDYGSELTVDLQWNLSDNISWKTRLYGYTTYERAELEWENTFVFKFNKYFSTNLFVYPRFDDGADRDEDHGYWQLKEYLSLGFNYSF